MQKQQWFKHRYCPLLSGSNSCQQFSLVARVIRRRWRHWWNRSRGNRGGWTSWSTRCGAATSWRSKVVRAAWTVERQGSVKPRHCRSTCMPGAGDARPRQPGPTSRHKPCGGAGTAWLSLRAPRGCLKQCVRVPCVCCDNSGRQCALLHAARHADVPFWELPPTHWHNMMTAGVLAAVTTSRLAVPLMMASGGGG